MLNLIKNKKKEVMTARDLQASLIKMSVEFLEVYAPKLPVSIKAKQRLEILKEVGLEGINNTVKLNSIIKKNEINIEQNQLIRKVKSVCSSALIVPWDDFYTVLKKYNLAVGPIKTYKKPIPEKNLDDIIKAKELNDLISLNNLFCYKEININSDTINKKELQLLVDVLGKLPFIPTKFNGEFTNVNSDLYKVKKIIEGNPEVLYSCSAYLSSSKNWFIAAPIVDMPDNVTIKVFSKVELDKQIKIEDPIVFKANEFGAIIVTMWDKEADDEIFEKYKENFVN